MLLNLLTLVCSGVVYSQNLSDNLIAHYEFTNGSVSDLSGNFNDAVNVGGTVTTGVANAADEAMSLASGSHIKLPSGILLNTNLSISLWFKSSNSGGIIGYQNTVATSTPSQHVPIAYLGTDSKLKATYWQGTQTQIQGANVNHANNVWHHMVLTVKPNVQKVYIDGVLTGSANSGHTILSSMIYNQIGKAYSSGWDHSPSGWHNFFGSIDKVRIYDAEISATIVSDIYDLEVLGGTTVTMLDHLIADYPFGGGSMEDVSSFERDALNSGTVSTVDRFGNLDSAVYLDGTSHIDLPSGILLGSTRSVSVWFKTSTSGSILGYQNAAVGTTPSQYVPIAFIRTDNKLSAAFWSNSVDASANSSTVNYADNGWHHLVLTTTGNIQKVYIDNVLEGTRNSGHAVLSGMTNHQIGTSYTNDWNATNGSWFNFTGSIDDFKVYDIELNVATIDDLFNAEDPNIITGVFSAYNKKSLTIYPNPASEVINTEEGNLTVFDALGSQVLNIESTGQVDVSNLESGIYFVTQNGKRTKLIIE